MVNDTYITVNENQDIWRIDFNNGIAKYEPYKSLNDLELNGFEYEQLNKSIYEYLEDQQFEILESTETKIRFRQ